MPQRPEETIFSDVLQRIGLAYVEYRRLRRFSGASHDDVAEAGYKLDDLTDYYEEQLNPPIRLVNDPQYFDE